MDILTLVLLFVTSAAALDHRRITYTALQQFTTETCNTCNRSADHWHAVQTIMDAAQFPDAEASQRRNVPAWHGAGGVFQPITERVTSEYTAATILAIRHGRYPEGRVLVGQTMHLLQHANDTVNRSLDFLHAIEDQTSEYAVTKLLGLGAKDLVLVVDVTENTAVVRLNAMKTNLNNIVASRIIAVYVNNEFISPVSILETVSSAIAYFDMLLIDCTQQLGICTETVATGVSDAPMRAVRSAAEQADSSSTIFLFTSPERIQDSTFPRHFAVVSFKQQALVVIQRPDAYWIDIFSHDAPGDYFAGLYRNEPGQPTVYVPLRGSPIVGETLTAIIRTADPAGTERTLEVLNTQDVVIQSKPMVFDRELAEYRAWFQSPGIPYRLRTKTGADYGVVQGDFVPTRFNLSLSPARPVEFMAPGGVVNLQYNIDQPGPSFTAQVTLDDTFGYSGAVNEGIISNDTDGRSMNLTSTSKSDSVTIKITIPTAAEIGSVNYVVVTLSSSGRDATFLVQPILIANATNPNDFIPNCTILATNFYEQCPALPTSMECANRHFYLTTELVDEYDAFAYDSYIEVESDRFNGSGYLWFGAYWPAFRGSTNRTSTWNLDCCYVRHQTVLFANGFSGAACVIRHPLYNDTVGVVTTPNSGQLRGGGNGLMVIVALLAGLICTLTWAKIN
ncbi:uncharacterized protein LOC129589454 isoform X2 [Paramacrobiotus metropolitanus]|uniref:uncharacterized protein LOC129589454 isoform X2 n=1 Tax=Paramacrobiotus metropolitanus TaxID=2943436 RepID=UPI0024459612|nr:uncharacterized protein LOC129589454 isoform X2 [Paramacrobiotus metropolitanus]